MEVSEENIQVVRNYIIQVIEYQKSLLKKIEL
jgi:hypothetical protein